MTQRPIRVLLVEHDPDDPDRPSRRLGSVEEANVEVEWVDELAAALERLSQGGFDAVLLDLDLPDSQGIVTFERTYAFAPDVPIVVLTDDHDETVAVATVQGGAQDHLVKDEAHAHTLVRALRYAIERHRLLSALRSLSLIDDLTGLYNRRGFADLGEQYLKLARRSARGVTLVYLDLDRFKTINDTLGHHVGDRALLKVADLLKAAFRRSDIIARMGGDEFAVLALESSEDSAEMLLDRLREKIVEFNRSKREPYQLAVSLGMARADDESQVRLEDLLARADLAMYEEKRGKRRAALR
ncbi:MAG: GGDEF domain-containing response regulator [Gemmatimonadetes bacterium]|nr:GGDEF domain-containing response regulator [Gemmatimonadota bacterium]